MSGRQVDKVAGNYAWIGNEMINIEYQKRLASADLRRYIYYAMAGKTAKELSDIRKFIESKSDDGTYFSQGQLAGVVKNMLNSKELVNLGRGIYQAGPAFDKKAAIYLERTPISIPQYIDLPKDPAFPAVSAEKDQSGFLKKRGELLKKLEKSMEAIRNEINGATVSELSDEDFTFIREFRQLDKIIQEFSSKYKND